MNNKWLLSLYVHSHIRYISMYIYKNKFKHTDVCYVKTETMKQQKLTLISQPLFLWKHDSEEKYITSELFCNNIGNTIFQHIS